MTKIKIGVLLPTSKMFPSVDRDFLLGLRAGLHGCAHECELVIEPTGNAAVPMILTEKVQRMLLQQAPAVVVGILGSVMPQHMHSHFADARTPFVVNNIGVEPLLDAGVRQRHVFHNSFNMWRSTFAFGYWAARHVGSTACLSIGYHEAGYGIVSAFWNGFAEGGGTVLATEVTHKASSDEDPSGAIQRLAAHEPAFIMGLYAGQSGVSFANAYSRLRIAEHVTLLSSALMVHDRWLAQMDPGMGPVRTAFSWDRDERAPAYQRFVSACRQLGDDPPDLFAMLGYETGHALQTAFARVGPDAARRGALVEALAGVVIESPRGPLTIDRETGETTSSHHLLEVRPVGNTGARVRQLALLEVTPTCAREYSAFKSQEMRSGWMNPYLVT